MTDQPMPSVDYSTQEINRPPSPSLVTLFYCVVGSKTPFSVDISSSLTVGHLKQMIQQNGPNLLKGIDAADLELFKVSVLEEDDIARNVEDVIEVAEALDPTTEIIEIFPDDPPKKTIHIAVVRNPTAHRTVANSNVSGDSGRSSDTLFPRDSASQASSRESGIALSSFARNNVDFERYLTATQCVYDLDNLPSDRNPMSENAKQIKEILGELPEKPSSFDLSLRYVAQCLELHVARRLTGYLRTLNKKEEQALQRETENLYQTWDLGRIHPDLEAIRERLKPAALVTVQPQIKDLSPLTCRVGFLKGLEELLRTHSPRLREEDYIWTFDIVNLTTPWELIERTWQDAAIQEKTLRKPVDQLYTTIFGDHTFMEYCTIPVSAKSRIDKGPGVYFIADQYKTHSFIIEQTEQFLFDHRELLNLLRWRWNAKPPSESGLVEIPLLAQEFKTINSREAANQCAADLITGATINELLDIQFPCYGLVVTLEECSLYAARAQLQPDGTLKYAVQKIDEWGTLKKLPNYLKYVKFVLDHKAWFEDNIVRKLINKRNEEDPGWAIRKLTRANIKPWAYQGNTASSSVHSSPGKYGIYEWLAKS